MAKRLFSLFTFPFLLLTALKPALAHGIGQTYTLPLPLWLYLWGSGAVVFLSFVVIGLFIGKRKITPDTKITVSTTTLRIPQLPLRILQFVSLFLFFLTILTGLFGNQDPVKNFSPNFIWAVFIIVFVVTSALFGNYWQYLNPFKIIFNLIEKLLPKPVSLNITYPKSLKYWPAVAFYLAFIWLELASGFSAEPRILAFFIVIYSTITFWGMILFGKDTWLEGGEFLTVLANFLSRFSPLEYKNEAIFIRNPVNKLIDNGKIDFSLVMFIILTLAGVAFDSFKESPLFFQILAVFGLESTSPQVYQSLGVLLMSAPYLLLYFFFSALGKILSGTKETMATFASTFALSLLPISLAYFVAHFYSLFLIQGQALIYLVSDPFGIGWNLFGTAGYEMKIGFLRADHVWFSQIGLIVLGHVAAIYLAHYIALNVFINHRQAILSQYPMATLMIFYTVFSLWLLSQPIVVQTSYPTPPTYYTLAYASPPYPVPINYP